MSGLPVPQRIVLGCLRGEATIAELCRLEAIAQGIYYKSSKEYMDASKRRSAGDTARAASTGEGAPPGWQSISVTTYLTLIHLL
jgi:hypothetical protein